MCKNITLLLSAGRQSSCFLFTLNIFSSYSVNHVLQDYCNAVHLLALHGRNISEDDSELLSCVTGKETRSTSLHLKSDRILNGAKGSGKVSLQEDSEGSVFSIWNRQKQKLYAAETVSIALAVLSSL